MKRGAFIRELVDKGCYLKRHGGRHDIYVNPKSEYKTAHFFKNDWDEIKVDGIN